MSAVVLDTHLAMKSSVNAALLPIMAVVFIGFLIIGMVLPVLPLHVHHDLGLSTFVVGLVTGSQFLAALVIRVQAGVYADRRGAKRAVVVGLVAAMSGGVLYVVSLPFASTPATSAAILLLGRALIGGAESFIITGGVTLGLALAGPQNAGKVIAWVGMAMFAALASGAPLGTMLYGHWGFAGIAIATVLIPLATLILVVPLPSIAPRQNMRPSLLTVATAVWLPGFASALSTVGFGALIAFSSLLSTAREWQPVWLLFSAFAFALVAARLFLGHLPDRFGGARIALLSAIIEGVGLALIWLAPSQSVAVAGALLTGLGYALVYPGLGAEAVSRAPPESRGLAMGAYTAFLDVALGFGSPALGLMADWRGLSAVFMVGATLVLGTALIVGWLLYGQQARKDSS
jgi:MFS family permease